VANLATRRPALVVVDDAHWADPPSLRWLGHLARRLEGLPLLLAVAVRAGEPSSDHRLLEDVLAAAAEPPLRPRPLGRAAAATVVRAHFAGPVDDGFCDACHAATGGNPFLLGALLASLRAEGVAPRREAAPTIESFGPEAVARAVARQLERLPTGAVKLARAVALLADAAPLRRAAALAGLEPTRAARVADALRAAGVLGPTTRLEFAHPVVRAAIYASLGAGERGLWHERAARLLRAECAARLCCAQRHYEEARDDLLEAARRWEALGIRHPGLAAWRIDAATALAAIGDTAESQRWRASTSRSPSASARVARSGPPCAR
jgi:predicted ATPase